MEEKQKKILYGLALGLPLIYILKKAHQILFENKKTFLCIEMGGQSVRASLVSYNKRTKQHTEKKTFKIDTPTPVYFLKFLKDNFKSSEFQNVCVASFGPLILKEGDNYGKIIKASSDKKISWEQISIPKLVHSVFPNKPLKMETDVNASALGEFYFGNHGAKNSLAYITLGTGIGVGLIINSQPVHGFQHPEGGHLL
jgi:fructokinase